jgi:hypothetical protein
MPNTYTLINSSTISTPITYIDFTSIPSTYTDLLLRVSARSNHTGSVGSDGLYLEINNSTADQSRIQLYGDGGSSLTGSGSGTTNYIGAGIIPSTGTASVFTTADIYFVNYSSSTLNKSFYVESALDNNSGTAWELDLTACRWAQTTAINQLTLKLISAANFAQHTTAYIYGISKT